MAEQAGFEPGPYLIELNVDQDDIATFTSVALRTPGSGTISLHKGGTSAMQIAALFDEDAKYQPMVRQRNTPIFTTDSEGRPCLAIGLMLGQEFHKTPRKRGQN